MPVSLCMTCPAFKASADCMRRICREEIDDLAAFQRQYDNDNSWEDLQEDEFGRLLSLVEHTSPVTIAETGITGSSRLCCSIEPLACTPHVMNSSD